MGIIGSRQMQRILGIHVIIVGVLGFAMSSACAESLGPNVTTFDVKSINQKTVNEHAHLFVPGAGDKLCNGRSGIRHY